MSQDTEEISQETEELSQGTEGEQEGTEVGENVGEEETPIEVQ